MKVYLIFVGKTRQGYLQEGIQDFLQRLRRYVRLKVVTVPAEPLKPYHRPEQVVATESKRVAAAVPAGSHLVVLDRRGEELSSRELARWWQRLENAGCQHLCFALGGVLGLSAELRLQAETVLSLSRMTFTHEMSRLILLEQLYRACTIIRGEKYHR